MKGLHCPGKVVRPESEPPGLVIWTAAVVLLMTIWPVNAAENDQPSTVMVSAGPEYADPPGGKQWLLGENYRDLWTAPIEVELLDLRDFAGGLTPVMRVGGFQSAGLALKGEDGRDYTFRSVNKSYTGDVIPAAFRGTFVEDIIQDQISGHFPAGQLVAGPIERAAGVRGLPDARLVVMPDDPSLGEFREEFAHVLGFIVEFPQPVSDTNPGYQGATEILGQEEFWAQRLAGPENRPDSRAYLRARLVDLFLNDWDRHDGNWRWGRFPDEMLLQPMPEDRDQVFASFEGLSLDLARLQGAPFVRFGDEYEPFHRLLKNGWDIDRYLLSDIERDDWIQIARDVQARLTDDAINEALQKMPPEYYELRGQEIANSLRKRRDGLVELAEDYYLFHAGTVDIYCTNASEVVNVEGRGNNELAVSVTATRPDGAAGPPYYWRTFHVDETDEIRIYLYGGTDTVVTRGAMVRGIRIRVIGGPGANTVNDSDGFPVKLYSSEGQNQIVGNSGSKLDSKPFIAPPRDSENDLELVAPRDWGSSIKPVWMGAYHTDPGLTIGAGIDYQRYGFRRYPWASRHTIKGAWGFGAQSGILDYKSNFRAANSRLGINLEARVSGLEYLRFHGIGNETPYDEDNDSLYEISTTQYTLFPSLAVHYNNHDMFAIGPIAKYTDSTDTDLNTVLGQSQPLGFGEFGQVGVQARAVYDSRSAQKVLSPGWLVQAEGAHYVEGWDVEDSFSYVEARVGRWFRLSEPVLASLNLRARKVWGDYPFFEASYIGGDQYPLGTRWNRWAGDSSVGVLGSLRWTIATLRGVLPGNLGVFGMANTARVYVSGEDSSKWHSSYAGGLVLTAFDHTTALHLGIGTSADSGSFVMMRGTIAAAEFR